MGENLLAKKCVPCEGGVPPLSGERAEELLAEVPKWELSRDGTKISRMFSFDNFILAMTFVNDVADLAQQEDHHPDIHISYNKVTLELTTHAIAGLSENDFILAAKVDTLT